MSHSGATIAIPTQDLQRAYDFYRDGLELPVAFPVKGGGMPEPVQFRLSSNVHLMIVPAGGFAYVAAANQMAESGT